MDPEIDIASIARKNILPIILGGIGLILLAVGFFQFFYNKTEESPLVFEEGSAEEEEITEFVVDVSGAVINPGVYKLKPDARIVDALAQAGGLSEDADRQYVEKNINLAGKVSDGLKLYIPRTGEEILSADGTNGSNSSIVGSGSEVINVNTASSSQLEELPGIGEVTAQKIIDGRPYSTIEDLLTKKVVGNAAFEKIKDKIAAN